MNEASIAPALAIFYHLIGVIPHIPFLIGIAKQWGQPTEPPYVWALIDLDGDNVIFIHVIVEVTPDEVRTGMHVQVVWGG